MTRVIGVFLYDRFQLLDAAGPITAFELAAEAVPEAYRVEFLSLSGGRLAASSGLPVETTAIRDAPPLDTLIVVGGHGTPTAIESADSLAYLRAAAEQVRRICSVCSGAFLLAAAGLLAGRKVTTHWRFSDALQKACPECRVEADRLHIHDGSVWTSGGVSAGIDLSLALITEDLGEAVARRVAQDMVVYYRRPGGQTQFSSLAELGGDNTTFSSLLDWMREHLEERLTVEQLADRMAMSPRNFSRAFTAAVGLSPAKAVEQVRLGVARDRVENSQAPLTMIAAQTGFHDTERMRRAFVRTFGQPPQALRRTAG